MGLRALTVNGFRNLQPQELSLPETTIAVLGANGAGKTSLLEAVAVLGNLASFRPGSAVSWVQHGAAGFKLAATVARSGADVGLTVTARAGRRLHRQLFRGGRRLAAAEFLSLFPVVAFSSADRLLIWGGPEERRRFLDRLSFYLRPETYLVLQSYRQALRQRNAALQRGGSDGELAAFEHHLAALGGRLLELRLAALAHLEDAFLQELAALEWSLSRPIVRYNDTDGASPGSPAEMAGRLRLALARSRRRERARAHTLVGPHRHDVEIVLAGAPAREVVSAGQGKLLATALKLAAMAVVERMRSQVPMVVFDDVDAELDASALSRVVRRIAGRGQLIVSSAHEAMIAPCLADAAVWRISEGLVAGAERYEGASS